MVFWSIEVDNKLLKFSLGLIHFWMLFGIFLIFFFSCSFCWTWQFDLLLIWVSFTLDIFDNNFMFFLKEIEKNIFEMNSLFLVVSEDEIKFLARLKDFCSKSLYLLRLSCILENVLIQFLAYLSEDASLFDYFYFIGWLEKTDVLNSIILFLLWTETVHQIFTSWTLELHLLYVFRHLLLYSLSSFSIIESCYCLVKSKGIGTYASYHDCSCASS